MICYKCSFWTADEFTNGRVGTCRGIQGTNLVEINAGGFAADELEFLTLREMECNLPELYAAGVGQTKL